nr:MAG TPA: hypothetical protein [Bacteriophage sp.]
MRIIHPLQRISSIGQEVTDGLQSTFGKEISLRHLKIKELLTQKILEVLLQRAQNQKCLMILLINLQLLKNFLLDTKTIHLELDRSL